MLTDELRATREKIVLDHFRDEVAQRWDDVLSTFPHPRYELVPSGVVHDGDAQMRQYHRDTRVAFSDQRHEMIALRHSDDAVICEFYLLGTHKGLFSAIPPPGNPFKMRMTAFFIFDGATLTCERIYFDTLTFLRQLLGPLDYKKPGSYLLLMKALWGMRNRKGKPHTALA